MCGATVAAQALVMRTGPDFENAISRPDIKLLDYERGAFTVIACHDGAAQSPQHALWTAEHAHGSAPGEASRAITPVYPRNVSRDGKS